MRLTNYSAPLALGALSLLSSTVVAAPPPQDSHPYPHPHPAGPELPQGTPNVTTIHNFGPSAWVQDFGHHKNGTILATLANAPEVWLVGPDAQNASTKVYSFPGFSSCLGIVEGGRDVFYVVTGNWSTTTSKGVKGANAIWKLNMTSYQPPSPLDETAVTKVVDVPDATSLNGLAHFKKGLLLAADATNGAVYSVNLNTSTATKVIDNVPEFQSNNPGLPIGLGGIKFEEKNSSLLFANPSTSTLGKVTLDENGKTTGPVAVVAANTPATAFIMARQGDAVIAQTTNEIIGYNATTQKTQTIASVSGPTALGWGRGPGHEQALIVSTAGGDFAPGSFNVPKSSGGTILKLVFPKKNIEHRISS